MTTAHTNRLTDVHCRTIDVAGQATFNGDVAFASGSTPSFAGEVTMAGMPRYSEFLRASIPITAVADATWTRLPFTSIVGSTGTKYGAAADLITVTGVDTGTRVELFLEFAAAAAGIRGGGLGTAIAPTFHDVKNSNPLVAVTQTRFVFWTLAANGIAAWAYQASGGPINVAGSLIAYSASPNESGL